MPSLIDPGMFQSTKGNQTFLPLLAPVQADPDMTHSDDFSKSTIEWEALQVTFGGTCVHWKKKSQTGRGCFHCPQAHHGACRHLGVRLDITATHKHQTFPIA